MPHWNVGMVQADFIHDRKYLRDVVRRYADISSADAVMAYFEETRSRNS
jgi:hypothetical protein